jgi:hypothetical protein
MLLILLAASCVMGHGFCGYLEGFVLNSLSTRICSRVVLELELYPNFESVSEPESWGIRKNLLLIHLAFCCVMHHGFGCIAGVLFSNGSRFSLVLVLFSTSKPVPNFEPVFEPKSFTRNPISERSVLQDRFGRSLRSSVLERFSDSN